MSEKTIKKYSAIVKLLYMIFRPSLYKKMKAEELEMVDETVSSLPGDEGDINF